MIKVKIPINTNAMFFISKDSWNPLLFVTRSFQKIARMSQALFGAMQLARTFYFLGGN